MSTVEYIPPYEEEGISQFPLDESGDPLDAAEYIELQPFGLKLEAAKQLTLSEEE